MVFFGVALVLLVYLVFPLVFLGFTGELVVEGAGGELPLSPPLIHLNIYQVTNTQITKFPREKARERRKGVEKEKGRRRWRRRSSGAGWPTPLLLVLLLSLSVFGLGLRFRNSRENHIYIYIYIYISLWPYEINDLAGERG